MTDRHFSPPLGFVKLFHVEMCATEIGHRGRPQWTVGTKPHRCFQNRNRFVGTPVLRQDLTKRKICLRKTRIEVNGPPKLLLSRRYRRRGSPQAFSGRVLPACEIYTFRATGGRDGMGGRRRSPLGATPRLGGGGSAARNAVSPDVTLANDGPANRIIKTPKGV